MSNTKDYESRIIGKQLEAIGQTLAPEGVSVKYAGAGSVWISGTDLAAINKTKQELSKIAIAQVARKMTHLSLRGRKVWYVEVGDRATSTMMCGFKIALTEKETEANLLGNGKYV